jgi:hypothetical protein
MSEAGEVECSALKIIEGIVINHRFSSNISSKERLCIRRKWISVQLILFV